MLQVTPMTSGEHATAYYTAPETQHGVEPEKRGQWAGVAAERLGLVGEVKRADFLALSMNKDPRTGGRLTPRNRKNRNSGYDLCFDVPKSLSLYLAETGDQQVEKMILDAFKETMSDIENDMQTRVRIGYQDDRRDTGNMVYAWYTHRLSRPVEGKNDPQHHIHAFVFNCTYDQVENRWKAGQLFNIVTSSPLYRKAFHDRVANKLVAAGFMIRKTEHAFELSNVSRELIEKFSKRTMKVVGQAKNAFEKMWLLLKTREKKSDMGIPVSQWRSEMTLTERYTLRNNRPAKMPSYRPRAIMAERAINQEMER